MNKSNTLRILVAAGVLGFGTMLTTPTLAQQNQNDLQLTQSRRPPRPDSPAKPSTLMNYLVLAMIVGGVVGAALIPAKRGHQD